jgi:glycosyltransferase involved in cell wall biosynthesis
LRIGIASAGRFHVLDLARELHALGHEVRFYSYVPRRRGARFGLPEACQRPVTGLVSPLLGWQRLAPRLAPARREALMHQALDRAVAARLEPCDAFIFMSGIFLEAARAARRRFGARLWLERGSAHIEAQDAILAQTPGAERPSAAAIERELAGYRLADRIVVPSEFAARSFGNREGAEKLFLAPYGVDLDHFPLSPRPPRGDDQLRLLFVGSWSAQKGCDLLERAVQAAPWASVDHVGAVTDLPFPRNEPRFRHEDPVDQMALAPRYAAADALVLPSRQEGFGMVIAQALATGLPVICSTNTGGPDLARTPALAARIVVCEAGDQGALEGAMAEMRRRLATPGALPAMTEADRQSLSWRAYAERYAAELAADVARGPPPAPRLRRPSMA